MPDVVDVETRILRYGVVLVDLDGFANPSGVPVTDGSDEMAVVPVYAVVFLLCVLDDGRSVPIAATMMGLVFLESGVEIAACFPDVDLATVAGDPVHTWMFVGWVLVLVGVKDGVKLAGGLVSDEDVS